MDTAAGFLGSAALLAGVIRYRHSGIEAKRSLTDLRFNLRAGDLRRKTNDIVARSKALDDEIVALSLEKATFENTFRRMIELDIELAPVAHNVVMLKDVSTDEGIRNTAREMAEVLEKLSVERQMRADVLRVLKHVAANPGSRSSEELRFIKHTIRDYERNGLDKPEETRKKIEELKKLLSEKCIRFLSNLGEDKTEVLVDEAGLAGMDAAFVGALERRDGKLVVTMAYPHVIPIMDRCEAAETRRRVSTAFNRRCVDANVPLLEEAVAIRHQLAQLLGFPSHAHYQLDVTMAKTPEAVVDFLTQLRDKLLPAGAREREQLLALKREHCAARGEAFDGRLAAWDVRFYQRLWKEREFEVDMSEVKQYFPVDVVVRGMLATYQQVMGLRFTAVADPHVWHPDVAMYEVSDGLSGEQMGYFYLDLHPRPGKYTHACCMPLQSSCVLRNGERRLAVCALIANFTKPTADAPSLLEHGEVETLFHEFGHGVHYICARPDLPSFSAFSVEWDFIEAPSQMLENWVYEHAPLRYMSGHVADRSRKIPDELIAKLFRAKHANVAMLTLRQLTFGLFDQEIHSRGEARSADTYARIVKECTGVDAIEGTNFAAAFGHMCGGYDTKYYGYMWSKVLAQDFWATAFKDDCMNSRAGRRYRTTILQPGGTVDAMDMARELLGREPNDKAFLAECGLSA